jgi:phosphatidylglycerophosphatase A
MSMAQRQPKKTNEPVVRMSAEDAMRGHPAWWLATAGGIGYSPRAPGTIGALLGVALTVAISQIPSWSLQAVVILGLCAAGVPICHVVARQSGKSDPSFVIYDEIVTVPIVFLGQGSMDLPPVSILLSGFLLHRFFDITKPPPIRQLEMLPGGWGIMLDDVAAAAFACIVLTLALRL